jgi:hypothetical protein
MDGPAELVAGRRANDRSNYRKFSRSTGNRASFSERALGLRVPAHRHRRLGRHPLGDGSRRRWKSFLGAGCYLTGMLLSVVFGIFPMVLRVLNSAYSLTVASTQTAGYGLKIELIWWTLGVVLVTGYFTYVYRSSAGKVTLPQAGNEEPLAARTPPVSAEPRSTWRVRHSSTADALTA